MDVAALGSGRRWRPGGMVLAAVLLALPYACFLGADFDFDDDGSLVYGTPQAGLHARCTRFWLLTLDEFRINGPFRPITWLVWDGCAQLFGPQPLVHRAVRLAWTVLGAWFFLRLLDKCAVGPLASCLAGAVALWGPGRNEVWMALGLTEAIAMPFVLFALWAAVRAARGSRPWPWDLAGALAMLAALATKNVFMVAVPAQLALRVGAASSDFRTALRQTWPRAALLSLTLLLPVLHMLLFLGKPRTGGYALLGWGPWQLLRMSWAVLRAGGAEFLIPGLLALGVAAWPAREAGAVAWLRRTYVVAGALLAALGVLVYWPIQAASGRYTMPAAWGLDLCLAVLLARLLAAPDRPLRRVGLALFVAGLLAMLVSTLDRMDRRAARLIVLWDALKYVERRAEPGSRVVWCGEEAPRHCDVNLLRGEGWHFHWHLEGRGRRPDVRVVHSPEAASGGGPVLLLKGGDEAPPGAAWVLERSFRCGYRLGSQCVRCSLWSRGEARQRAEGGKRS